MQSNDNEKLSPVHDVASEGLSVLTSVQSFELQKYLKRLPRSYNNHVWDGRLYDAWREIYSMDPNVLKALDASIQDVHCTKNFRDVKVTFEQFNGFTEPEPINGLHYVNVRVACALVKEMLKVTHLEPISVSRSEELFNVWTNPKASAGAINIGSSKQDSFEEIFDSFKTIKSMVQAGVPFDDISIPALVFHRAQISGFLNDEGYYPEGLKLKDRFIWCLDGGSVSVEGQYAKPLINYLSNNWYSYAGGKDPNELRSMIRECRRYRQFWTSIDYSKFDQSIPSWLLQWCFSVVKEFFDKKYHKELDWIAYNFINTKVAIPGTGVKRKHKGIPSGSNFTQVIGSISNAVMMLSFLASMAPGKEFQEKMDYVRGMVETWDRRITMFVMGDDNLVFTHAALDLSKLSEYVHLIFGVRINPSKCERGTGEFPSFLKREWRNRGEWQDPRYLTINTIHYERVRSYNGYSPWHIIYGLYLTYMEAFPPWVSERWIVERMHESGGIKALVRIPKSDLPGVFRAYGDNALQRMVVRAERLLKAQ